MLHASFSQLSPQIKPLYTQEERKLPLSFPLFYLGVNSLPPSSWGKWAELSQSFAPSCHDRQVSKGCEPFPQLLEDEQTSAPQQPREPCSSSALAPCFSLGLLQPSPLSCQICSQGRMLQTATLRHESSLSLDKFPPHGQSYSEWASTSQRSGTLLANSQHP